MTNREHDPPPQSVDRPDLSGPNPAEEFGRLFDRYAPVLHRYLARRIGSDRAHDLVSETFLVALNRRHSYDPERAAVRSWLYGIATNLLRQHVRDELRWLRAGSTETETSHADHGQRVADRVDAATTARKLAGALADLSDGDRDVLLLTSWAGLDSTEIADALGIPVGTVRSRLHRVRRVLRANAPKEKGADHA